VDLKEQVRRETDLADLVAESTELSGRRTDMRGCCPLHGGDNMTSLSVNAETGLWQCFACGKAGDCFEWMMQLGDVDFPTALQELAERAGVAMTEKPWTLSDYASYVGLPFEFLGELGLSSAECGVLIPYRDASGDLLRNRVRHNRTRRWWEKDADHGGDRSYLYGLDRLGDSPSGPLIIVEGESDAQVLWYNGFASVGAPGQSAFKSHWVAHITAHDPLYVVREPDAVLPETVAEALRASKLDAAHDLRVVALDEGDVLDQWRQVSDSEGFRARFEEAMRRAEPLQVEDSLAEFRGDDGRLILPRMAEAIRERMPCFSLRGRLHVYAEGVYSPHGEELIRFEAQRMLGEEYRRTRLSEIVSYLIDVRPVLSGDMIDARADIVNVTNGLLDLSTLELRPHSPEYLSITQVPHSFESESGCPAIDRFLRDVLPPDCMDFAYELFGYVLRRDLNFQHAFMLLGDGANGKSVFIDIAQALVGERNVCTVALQDFAEDRFAGAELHGKLLNAYADLPARTLRDAGIFKSVVAGDRISAQHKGRDRFDFRPYCRFVFSANQLPPTDDHTDAYYRRWIVVPFPRRFAQGEATPRRTLVDSLTSASEMRGLMRRSLEAAGELASRGHFDLPESVVQATRQFRRDTNSVAAFVEACCRIGQDCWVPRQQLYDAYLQWCTDQGMARQAVSQPSFNASLPRRPESIREYQPSLADASRPKCWKGIGLRDRRPGMAGIGTTRERCGT